MIYFDNAATSLPYKEALATFLTASENNFGNSESNHAVGHKASKALEEARLSLLNGLGIKNTHNLCFTSGATESNNLALKGVVLRYKNRGNKILVSPVEHPSVIRPLEELKNYFGFQVEYLKVDAFGRVNLDDLKSKMDKNTILVSVMAVNNELGSENDVGSIADIVHAYPKCFFHSDLTQAMGKIILPYSKIDLFSFSSHKFGGVKGTGGLFFKKTISFVPNEAGGEQEFGCRAGTSNLAGDLATAKALELALLNQKKTYENVKDIYEYLRSYFLSHPEDYTVHSDEVGPKQTPFVLNIGFKKKKASVVVEALSNHDIYVSSVSACSTKELRASSTLLACGYSEEEASNSIRISFSRDNTLEEAKTFIKTLETIMKEIFDR